MNVAPWAMIPRGFAAASLAAASLFSTGCVESGPVVASAPAPAYDTPPGPPPAAPAAQSEGDLDRVLEPIALYPDPLLALILPASACSRDLVSASQYLVQYGDPSRIDSQPWDPSVRGLAHYPAILSWMAANLAWTEAVGSAFSQAPGEVMDAVQRLRRRALANGVLLSNSQQQVLTQGGSVEILPAQEDALYVPSYDSQEVFFGPAGGAYEEFGDAYPVGTWLSFCVDWNMRELWISDWGAWHGAGGWRPPLPERGAARWHPPAPNPQRTGRTAPVPQPPALVSRPVSPRHTDGVPVAAPGTHPPAIAPRVQSAPAPHDTEHPHARAEAEPSEKRPSERHPAPPPPPVPTPQPR